jgi:hypothetical protein
LSTPNQVWYSLSNQKPNDLVHVLLFIKGDNFLFGIGVPIMEICIMLGIDIGIGIEL